jgi:hypothetical protein
VVKNALPAEAARSEIIVVQNWLTEIGETRSEEIHNATR